MPDPLPPPSPHVVYSMAYRQQHLAPMVRGILEE